MQRTFEQVGVYDMRHLTFDDGAGLWLTLGVVQNEPRPLVGTATRWEQVRRHLKAALYAQHAFDALRARLDGTPCGPHEQLRRRLREIDARDGCLGTDGAAELWCGLARGAWSLLDQFDCAGRRCLVLAPRIDAGPDPRQLTPNDLELATLVVSGKSRKWIALTLGVARSTLNRRLETLVAKLGQRSRHDLLKTFRLWCGNAIPALALRAQALGSSRYLLSFRLDRPSAGDWTCPASLTPAQWRVIQLALEGLSDRAIAENLDISRYTVGHHLRNAYARLRVNSRAELFVDLGRRS